MQDRAHRDVLTRRQMLRLSASAAIGWGLWPGALKAAGRRDSGKFSFVVINDIHYRNEPPALWLDRVIARIKGHAEPLDFCFIVGDLAENGTADELATVRDVFKKLAMPVFTVVGNHDYLTPTDRSAYEQLFPRQMQYHFEHNGWQFVAFDSTQGQRAYWSRVQKPALRWLDDTLPQLDKNMPMAVITHFPLGDRVLTRPMNSEAVLERFKGHNLQAVLNGHWHGFTESKFMGATVTTNRCCSLFRSNHDGSVQKGYFLCRAEAGAITREFVEVTKA